MAQGTKHMTPVQMLKMGRLIEEHCKPIEGTKEYRYDDGWSDAEVAKQMGVPHINRDHAVRFRKQLNMDLAKPTPITVVDRLAALEARVAKLEEAANPAQARLALVP